VCWCVVVCVCVCGVCVCVCVCICMYVVSVGPLSNALSSYVQPLFAQQTDGPFTCNYFQQPNNENI